MCTRMLIHFAARPPEILSLHANATTNAARLQWNTRGMRLIAIGREYAVADNARDYYVQITYNRITNTSTHAFEKQTLFYQPRVDGESESVWLGNLNSAAMYGVTVESVLPADENCAMRIGTPPSYTTFVTRKSFGDDAM